MKKKHLNTSLSQSTKQGIVQGRGTGNAPIGQGHALMEGQRRNEDLHLLCQHHIMLQSQLKSNYFQINQIK